MIASRRWRQIVVTTLAIAAAAVIVLVCPPFEGARWLDENVLDERLRDTWGYVRYEEDWSSANALRTGLSYAWLTQSGPPVLIAHALGNAGQSGGDSLPALFRSLDNHLAILEVDVWLDTQGILRCHHGPELPAPFQIGDCTVPSALHAAYSRDAWLVLDIKSDFRSTGSEFLRQLAGDPALSHVIFQLYRPEDFAAFNEWASASPLPGPIVTAYLSHRSLRHVAEHAARAGAHVLTLPMARLPSLPASAARALQIFVHPISDCGAMSRALSSGASGFYITGDIAPRARRECRE